MHAIPAIRPRLNAAVQVGDAPVRHSLEQMRRERGAASGGAVRDDAAQRPKLGAHPSSFRAATIIRGPRRRSSAGEP